MQSIATTFRSPVPARSVCSHSVFRTLGALLICVTLLGRATIASAELVVAHQGDTDPTTEGFTGQDVVGSSTFGPIANDLGSPAWSVVGTAQDSQYSYTSGALSVSQLADIASQGFTLTIVARALPGVAPTYGPSQQVAIAGGGLNTGVQRFDIALGIDANGDTVAFLPTTVDANGSGPGGSLIGAGPSYTLTGEGNGYHTFSLVYDPVSQLADLFVDGVDRIQGYAGDTSFIENSGVYFGAASGGQANYNLVQFSSVPEPSSLALLTTAGLGLLACALRRRRSS